MSNQARRELKREILGKKPTRVDNLKARLKTDEQKLIALEEARRLFRTKQEEIKEAILKRLKITRLGKSFLISLPSLNEKDFANLDLTPEVVMHNGIQKNAYYINFVFVGHEIPFTSSMFRHLGLGSILLDKAKDVAKRNGAHLIYLNCLDGTERFYTQNGFVKSKLPVPSHLKGTTTMECVL